MIELSKELVRTNRSARQRVHLGIWHSNDHARNQNKLFPQTEQAELRHSRTVQNLQRCAQRKQIEPADVQNANTVGTAALNEASHAY